MECKIVTIFHKHLATQAVDQQLISLAINLAAISLGTKIDGSILCPSSYNLVIGIKPTIGLTSRA